MHFCDKESETLHHPFFLLHLLEYLLETSQKLLFHNNKPSYGSQPSRYHYRYYNIVMPITKLFDTNRKKYISGIPEGRMSIRIKKVSN